MIAVGTCEEEVRLETETANVHAEYVALSHVWGGSQPACLRASTLEEKKKILVFDDASKTLKEAVEVTRRLGIPYIWIDSLCIIQEGDAGEDWQLEAPRMGEIYNNATLTISSAAATSPTSGLFYNRASQLQRSKTLMLQRHGPGEDRSIFYRFRSEDVFSTREIAHSYLPIEQPHIKSRGWVLQEDLLSPRILHFRKEEMTWTCSTYSRCECRIRPSLPMPHPFRGARNLTPQTPERSRKLVLEWPSIVMEFTRRDLTKPQDRLMAMAGLANYMEGESKDAWMGGLWYRDIAFQLLWIREQTDKSEDVTRMSRTGPSQGSPPYILFAPSWSWASISGPIHYWHRVPVGSAPSHPSVQSKDAMDSLLIVVFLIKMPLVEGAVYGSRWTCGLFAHGFVLPIFYHEEDDLWFPEIKVADLLPANLKFYIDVPAEDPRKDHDADYSLILAGQWVGEGMTLVSMQATCILVRSLEDERVIDDINETIYRLGLEEELDRIPTVGNSYTRVGLVRCAGSVDAWLQVEELVQDFFLF